ncbi:uncharacterized protein LOC108251194 [Kryptolebias marmoratus]|uniref:uncharacterized protein LOC108251194 n=1 Tax=Kryptolebias marmoratus TaxID=37003 RepID=UPI0007F92591|nr:uncharacterized protein LOC108251194 [Kryptolebias marmoratus]
MDSTLQTKGHVSIQKGLAFPPLEKCTTCCVQGQYHCPFCSPAFFKPAKRCKVMRHLDIHIKRACFIGEFTIHKCGLFCWQRPHYHCLYCITPMESKMDLTKHLALCEQRPKTMDSLGGGAARVTFGDLIELPSYFDSNDESENENDDEYTIPDAQDENSQEGSGNNSASHFDSRYKKPKMAASKRPLVLSRCDQMVQANMDRPQDCDEFYFMNLVKVFKKLTPHKKTEVRMKIERILFEAEFQ